VLRPQDLVIALHLATGQVLPQRAMSDALGLSQPEISNALRRLRAAHLLLQEGQEVILPNLLEFCIHGVRYAFAAEVGRPLRGIPTAAMVSPLKERISSEDGLLVWPAPDGEERAPALEPLHTCVVHAARRDPKLYRMLALVDGIRIGKNRMRAIAAELLANELAPDGQA
jgi:hypothetical protein